MRKKIVTWMIDNGSIDEEEREIYEYAIQSLKLLIMPVFLCGIYGIYTTGMEDYSLFRFCICYSTKIQWRLSC